MAKKSVMEQLAEIEKDRQKKLAALSDSISEEVEALRDKINIDIQNLNELVDTLSQATGRTESPYVLAKAQENKSTKTKEKGGRRSAEQLAADAKKVVEMVKAAGSSGISGADIKKSQVDTGLSIKDFVKKHAAVDLKTKGERAAMKYYL